MEFDKEATVPCSATGREKPTIKWVRAGGYCVGTGRGVGRAICWSDVCMSEDQLSAQCHARSCGDRQVEGQFIFQLGRKEPDPKEIR